MRQLAEKTRPTFLQTAADRLGRYAEASIDIHVLHAFAAAASNAGGVLASKHTHGRDPGRHDSPTRQRTQLLHQAEDAASSVPT